MAKKKAKARKTTKKTKKTAKKVSKVVTAKPVKITPSSKIRTKSEIYNAISGNLLLVWNGAAVEGLNASEAEPRTAVGLDRPGRRLVIVVVDGRQAGYSEGATLAELAQIIVEQKAYRAMNLDGGGSSTLVVEENGEAKLLNSPVHGGNPGTERPVGNHLGFAAK